jgi:NAD+ synthase (glutamine-hydrolysing)
MLEAIRTAQDDKADIIVFPEMAIPGYLIGDDWERESFLRECEQCGREVLAASRGIVTVFGNIAVDWNRKNEDGRVRKYNALFVADEDRFKGPDGGDRPFAVKTLMPNYRQFDDSRHFFDLRKIAFEENKSIKDIATPITTSLGKLGCVLCEDAWNADYAASPMDMLAAHRPDLFISISSSPYTLNKNHKRNRLFSAHAAAYQRPIVYINHTGIQNNGKTVFTYDGSSCIYDSRGNSLSTGKPFTEHFQTAEIDLAPSASFGSPVNLKTDTIADICDALTYGTRKFMAQCGISKVTIGASGGIDSCVVAALYGRILRKDELLLVNMPGEYTSSTTRRLAHRLAEGLGCLYAEIPIEESVALTEAQIRRVKAASTDGTIREKLDLSPFMLENVQARDRSSRILAAASSAFGGVFTCNANKSEMTVGYTTLYGDLDGYLANIADLWKMEVYDLAHHLNRNVYGREVIPAGAISIKPSAELSAAQNVDEGKGDPMHYPYHDCLFRSWVETWNRTTPEEIIDWYSAGDLERKIGFDGNIRDVFPSAKDFVTDLEYWWKQYQGIGVAKRIQAPPVLAVKRRAFGFDHRESQMGAHFTRRYGQIREKLLEAK